VEGKREYQERCLSFLGEYSPNMKKVNRRVTISWSPKDIENHLPTMRRGSIKHGAYISLQMGYNRPFPEASGYRTPVEGLYVGGASVHPGGMIIAGPGYNSARVIAEDFHIPWKWGELPEVEKALRDGYLCPGREE
jgi:phytoene dehydrogenase-like protein